MIPLSNYSLKEEIRQYWSERSATFDRAFGHRIRPGAEFDAWRKAIASQIGSKPLNILELACGTGEVTAVLLSLGHQVTAIDFSEAMLRVAREKHRDRSDKVTFLLADAENTFLPGKSFDAIVCRHLVWTLTEPHLALKEWRRLLRPDGRLLIFDGNWAQAKPVGRLAENAIAILDRWQGADPFYDGAMSTRHASIMAALPFGDGLTAEKPMPLLAEAGFVDCRTFSYAPIERAARKGSSLRNRLRTLVYRRFILSARRQ